MTDAETREARGEMGYDHIVLEINEGVALLRLNRPHVLNSLDAGLIADMREALAAVSKDPAVRALVLTGAGRAFCAGADLTGGKPRPGASIGETVASSMEEHFNPLAHDLFHLDMPTIAAVNGVAAGGGVGVALAADLVFAARSASFKLVFVPQLGIVPDVGASFYLQRLVGRARALGISMLGESVSAEQAAEWGMIWRCVDDDELMHEAMSTASRLAAGPTLAYPRLRSVLDASQHNTLDQQLDLELQTQRVLTDSPDFLEGVAAFLQKRPPIFKGR